jgi:outer membrane protein OmpA-like peptidoglycan-associated protein
MHMKLTLTPFSNICCKAFDLERHPAQPQGQRLWRRLVWITGLVAVVCSAQAGTVRYYAQGQVPDPAVVASILGQPHASKRMKMRGGTPSDEPAAQLSATDSGLDVSEPLDDPAARELALSSAAQQAVQRWQTRLDAPQRLASATAESQAASQPTPQRSLALEIQFDNGSAQLKTSAQASLMAVAQGMRLARAERSAAVFVIEGHTSANGTRAHNLRLSRERASSVKRYLVQHCGVSAAALKVMGKGSSAPLNAHNPNAPENRRVQFRAA